MQYFEALLHLLKSEKKTEKYSDEDEFISFWQIHTNELLKDKNLAIRKPQANSNYEKRKYLSTNSSARQNYFKMCQPPSIHTEKNISECTAGTAPV